MGVSDSPPQTRPPGSRRLRGVGTFRQALPRVRAHARERSGWRSGRASRAAELYGVAFQAANSAIVDLAAKGILREMTGRPYADSSRHRVSSKLIPNGIFQ